MRNLVILLCFCACSGDLFAQLVTFGGDQQFSLEFVEIGHPKNPDDPNVASGWHEYEHADTLPSGGVDYTFWMSKFQISLGQFQIADAQMELGYSVEDAIHSHIRQGAENIPRPKMPVIASWSEAAHFVNWLNVVSGYEPAYKYDFHPGEEGFRIGFANQLWTSDDQGYNPENQYRNGMARFALPTLDEWHKAAYYDPEKDGDGYWQYSTATDEPAIPVASGTEPGTAVYNQPRAQGPADVDQAGGTSAYGVVGMGGNLREILEDPWNGIKETVQTPRNARGHPWFVNSQFPADVATQNTGFTVHFSDGIRVVDLGEIPAGDFNGDRVFTPRDIDELIDAINSPEPSDFYDLNGDGSVNADDRTFWIEELANVNYGDADMNGEVDFGDFLALSGAYETDGGWSGGDFDGSGLTDFDDFLTLSGNFGQTVTKVASVPEASSFVLLSLSLLTLGAMKRHAANRTCSKAESSLVSPWTEC